MQMSKSCFRNFNGGKKNRIGTAFNQEVSTTLFYFNSVTSFTVSSRKKKRTLQAEERRIASPLYWQSCYAIPWSCLVACVFRILA